MKSLRHSADRETLNLVYKSLCQTLLLYCIKVWGGAAKTKMLALERAQRAVLKVMLKKPFRFPTDRLYEECGVLRVRQLFILRSVVAKHREVLVTPDYNLLLERRVPKIKVPLVHTTFAKRLPQYIQPYLYNSVCRNLRQLTRCSTNKVKKIVEKWLLSLDYTATENVLPSSLTC